MVGTLVRGCRCATAWCDLDLTFDLAAVTLAYKILFGQYLVGILVTGSRCATSWCDLDLTFDLVIVTMSFKILTGLFLGVHNL